MKKRTKYSPLESVMAFPQFCDIPELELELVTHIQIKLIRYRISQGQVMGV